MNKQLGIAWATLALAGSVHFSLAAAELATVTDDRVNVRGLPSLGGEVITQVRKGETVVVLEEITLAKPKPEEPANWSRIQIPTNTPVWVNASFIDETNKTVKARKLNIRGGPGENFSVLGVVEKGFAVKDIRVVDNWMEIEAPTNAFGFVASSLLLKAPATTPAAPATPPVTLAAATPVETPKPAAVEPQATPPPVTRVVVPEDASATVATPVSEPVKPQSRPPAQATPVQPTVVTLPPPAAGPAVDEPLPKRVVTREGVVRRATSIQAPTSYQLVSTETGEPLNYLLTDKIDIKLDGFKGRKILVTGEELMDKRWPKTPVIEVDTLRIVP